MKTRTEHGAEVKRDSEKTATEKSREKRIPPAGEVTPPPNEELKKMPDEAYGDTQIPKKSRRR